MSGTSLPLKKKIEVRLNRIRREADGILSFEFVDPTGAELPAFTAGAHIEVHITPEMIRSYSISSDPSDKNRYEVAVLKETAGRGGSLAMHERLKEGDVLTITAPINHFPLAGKEARAHLLLAGGIGVTPMMAMISELEAKNANGTCTI